MSNDGLWRKIAIKTASKFWANASFDIDDLMQEARYAAMLAWNDWDPAMGAKYTSYAGIRVMWYLNRYLRRCNGLPLSRIKKDPPTVYNEVDDKDVKLADIAIDDTDDLSRADAKMDIASVLSTLTNPRERAVFRARFLEEKTHAQARAEIGIGSGRMYCLERSALNKIGERFRKGGSLSQDLPSIYHDRSEKTVVRRAEIAAILRKRGESRLTDIHAELRRKYGSEIAGSSCATVRGIMRRFDEFENSGYGRWRLKPSSAKGG